MEAADGEDVIQDADLLVPPPDGGMNELLHVGQENNIQGQVRLDERQEAQLLSPGESFSCSTVEICEYLG